MRRREFLGALGGVVAAWPGVAHAQQAGKLPTIGILGATTAAAQAAWTAAFVQRLQELGWTDGRTVSIEYRWIEGRTERYGELASELVRLKVDVIVTSGGAVDAAKRATSTIPIVFTVAGDPIGSGFIASLARPGGNITGLSLQQVDLAAKRLELLREVIPSLRTLAVLFNGGYSSSLSEVREVAAPAQRLGIGVVPLEIRRSEDVVSAIDATRGRVEALYVVSEPLVSANRMRINTMALGLQMPTMHAFREYVETGGLMSYGPNLTDMWRRSADYVDKILRGTNASEIPVQQPTKFDLIINLTAAKALGLTVPPTVLAQANEVIE